MPSEDRRLTQAASRAAGVIGRFLTEFDAQPLTEALSPLTERFGVSLEVDAVTETTLLFSDLAGFSTWVLEAGDDRALELLRQLGKVTEPLIALHHGRLVKRLGSGHMAVFRRPGDGLEAALAMIEQTARIDVGVSRPALRVGAHLGMPQRVGGDYFGTDVNIAARLAEAARPGELLVSGQLLGRIGSDTLTGVVRRPRRSFRAKGTPADLKVYAVSRP